MTYSAPVSNDWLTSKLHLSAPLYQFSRTYILELFYRLLLFVVLGACKQVLLLANLALVQESGEFCYAFSNTRYIGRERDLPFLDLAISSGDLPAGSPPPLTKTVSIHQDPFPSLTLSGTSSIRSTIRSSFQPP